MCSRTSDQCVCRRVRAFLRTSDQQAERVDEGGDEGVKRHVGDVEGPRPPRLRAQRPVRAKREHAERPASSVSEGQGAGSSDVATRLARLKDLWLPSPRISWPQKSCSSSAPSGFSGSVTSPLYVMAKASSKAKPQLLALKYAATEARRTEESSRGRMMRGRRQAASAQTLSLAAPASKVASLLCCQKSGS